MSPTAPRVLVYSQDGQGLGHLRRTSSLIAELLRVVPDAGVLSVSDSPLGKFFPTDGQHDYLKLPSIRKEGPGSWRALALPMKFGDVLSLRSRLLRDVAVSFAPDLVLVDHMPHGAMGELLPTLEALRDSPVKIVLGLRDILDAPHVVRRSWSLEGAYDAVAAFYDEVLVYGSRDVFDIGLQYGWPTEAAARLRYCGYVSPPEVTGADGRALRARYLADNPRERLVLATAGGGADAYPLFRTLLDAAARLRDLRARLVVITGPFMPGEQQRDLRERARPWGVPVLKEVRDSVEHLAAADLVVSMAGYNTTAEIVRLGVPSLLVPRVGPSAEQRMRAELFADRGWVRWLPPEDLSPQALATAIGAALGAAGDLRSAGADRPDSDGRRTAVARLCRLLEASDVAEADADYAATASAARS